jgi:hypothetical protein
MTLQILFLIYHKDSFPESSGALNNGSSAGFHHDISALQKTYQAKWSSLTLADYCYTVTKDSPELCTKNRHTFAPVNQGVPVTKHCVMNFLCKVCIIQVCSFFLETVVISLFTATLGLSFQKSIKGNTFHL